MRKGTKKTAKVQGMTLSQAADVFSQRRGELVYAAATVNGRGVAVCESADMYWVYREGEYTRNERYNAPSQVLRAIGLGGDDPAIWQVRDGWPF